YRAVESAIGEMGGIRNFVKRGERVLIKPNLLSAHEPSRNITTHPEVVRAVARLCKDVGALVAIGDSPALDSFQRVCVKTGMVGIADELDIDLVEFTHPTVVRDISNNVFKRIELAKQVFEADKIINIPKLKTHSQMLMTLGVKNNFGTVVKQAKAEWHSTAGTSRELFATLLLDIYLSVRPSLTILDGIWGMEGMGPTNGVSKHIGIVAASEHAIFLDLAVLTMLNIEWERFPVFRQAKLRNLIDPSIEPPCFKGIIPDKFGKVPFSIPKLDSMNVIPKGLEALTRKYLVSKPLIVKELCERCERCRSICPKAAIKRLRNGLTIDYDLCIRCYCCQEVCDRDAIRFKKGIFLKITERLF
ncbi:MAG: DUF362 domain-containing protein, partial [Desulfatiglandales bacterium]